MKVGDRVIHKSGRRGVVIKSISDNFVIDWGIGIGQYTPDMLETVVKIDFKYYRELKLVELGI